MEYNDYERKLNSKAHMCFTESVKNRQQSMESIYRFIAIICRANVQSLLMFNRL